jgi:hypothetical protein
MRAFWISAGVIVWALHFAVIYGFTGLACARGWDGAIPSTVALATLAAGALIVIILFKGIRRQEFIHWMTTAVAALALVAIVWEGAPVLLVSPCGLR